MVEFRGEAARVKIRKKKKKGLFGWCYIVRFNVICSPNLP